MFRVARALPAFKWAGVMWVVAVSACSLSGSEPEPGIYRAVIERLIARGAEAIILGCTEISLLVDQSDSAVPLFDTTALHAAAAVEWAVS